MANRYSPPELFPDLPEPLAEGHGKFRPRTGLLRTIGSELISSEVVAVIELVRNCYDADASLVEVVFDSPENSRNASLLIRDDGHGMSKDVLLGPWLEPATDHKSGAARSGNGGERSPRGRRRLGSKGVGRFAAQRLGSMLEVRTRTAEMSSELIARFDWKRLDEDAYLDEVRIPWREGEARHIRSQGTHLYISDLRDRWGPERFDRLRLALSRLVDPDASSAFRICIVINGAAEDIESAIDVDNAMYSIRGSVDAQGNSCISYSDVNGSTEVWHRSLFWPSDPAQQCGPFAFRINAWDLDRGPLEAFLSSTSSHLGLRDFRRLIRDHSGVSLYRDGFRILPYGEPGHDWLRLDNRRVNNPTLRLSNNQILGSIRLTANGNPGLRDQTNREGLVDTDAYAHLSEVVRELLGYLETRRFAARRSMDVDWVRKVTSLPKLHDEATKASLDSLIGSLLNGASDRSDAAHLLRQHIQDFRESTADAVRHYAGLATAGQMSGLVVGQLQHPLRQIKSDLKLSLGELDPFGMTTEATEDAVASIQSAIQQVDTIEKRLQTLNPLAIGGRGRRISLHNVSRLIADVVEPFTFAANRLGVALEIDGDRSLEITTNREIAQQVLANLLDNAVWFASQGSPTTPSVTVSIIERGFAVSDNGLGVPEMHVGSIFEPHFSTREDGHGLGLTLSRDLLHSIGGRLRLASTQPAKFVVELQIVDH